ncbi:MAG TPA: hypothetical protein PK675_02090 [Clostridia bacterium]|nr:hypothetical protein [Clostridia bacterium]
MYHSFDVTLAKTYGLTEAILLNHFFFWILKNQKNNKHYHQSSKDGKFYYWTYSSNQALQDLFPYLTPDKIRGALDRLETKGVILMDNFNDTAYDRTKWYALNEKVFNLMSFELPYDRDEADIDQKQPSAQNDTCICSNQQMEMLKTTNAFVKTTNGVVKNTDAFGKTSNAFGKIPNGVGKTPNGIGKTPNGIAQNPKSIWENPEPIPDNITNNLTNNLSKNESNTKSRAGARVYPRESYEELMVRLGFSSFFIQRVFSFIQFLQLNGTVLTNEQLEQMLTRIELEGRERICGSVNAEVSIEHKKEIEYYIGLSIEQALKNKKTNLVAVKNYVTAAEAEAEAIEDLKKLGLSEEKK